MSFLINISQKRDHQYKRKVVIQEEKKNNNQFKKFISSNNIKIRKNKNANKTTAIKRTPLCKRSIKINIEIITPVNHLN